MLVATASRFRWPQHIALAGLVFNLTLAVGLAATYYVQERWGGGLGQTDAGAVLPHRPVCLSGV